MQLFNQKRQFMDWKVQTIIILVIYGFIMMLLLIFPYNQSKINNLTATNIELKKAGIQSNEDSAVVEDKLSQVKTENKELSNQVSQLKSQVSQLESQLSEAQMELMGEPTDLEQQIIDSLATNQGSVTPEPTTQSPTDRNRNRWQNLSAEERAQLEERLRDGLNQMRNRLAENLNAEMQKTSDPAAQDRLTQIQTYTDYNLDLFQELREATTDEQREALRQELSDNQNYVNALRQEQQNYMLSEIARQYGVNNSEGFINSIQETMRNPMFRGGSGGFGGFGGRGNFGGGPRGGFGNGQETPNSRGQQ